MSIHHYNRLLAHADLSNLSPLDKLVSVFIAESINSKKPDLMRLSGAYIAETLGLTLEAVQKSTKRLVDKGIFTRNSETRKPRSGYVYALAVTCPPNCEKAKAHKTPLELSFRGSFISEIGGEKEANSTPNTVQNGVTKQDKQDNQELTNNLTVNGNFSNAGFTPKKSFTYEQFEEAIDSCWQSGGSLMSNNEVDGHAVVSENLERAYVNALHIVEKKQETGRVSDPLAYVLTIYEENPLRLLAEAPGTSTARKQAKDLGSYEERVIDLCAQLGINYQDEFAGSRRESTLKQNHLDGRLTLKAVKEAYNANPNRSEADHLALY